MKGTNLPSTLTSMFRNIALLTHFLRQRFFLFGLLSTIVGFPIETRAPCTRSTVLGIERGDYIDQDLRFWCDTDRILRESALSVVFAAQKNFKSRDLFLPVWQHCRHWSYSARLSVQISYVVFLVIVRCFVRAPGVRKFLNFFSFLPVRFC